MSKIKIRKLALLLSCLTCHSELNALRQEPPIHIEKDETLTESEKEKDLQQPTVKKSSYLKEISKGLAYGVGLSATLYSNIRTVDDLCNSYQKSKILSSLNQYKNLPYNKRLREFLKKADELMTEHNKNDKGEANDDWEDIKRAFGDILLKTEDDFSKDIFASVKSASGVTCTGCTHVLQTIAEHLGLKNYRMDLYSSIRETGHTVLLILVRDKKTNMPTWGVIDGRNYIINIKKSLKSPYSVISLKDYYELSREKYDKMSIIKRKNVVSGYEDDLKNEIAAELNTKLLDRLNNGQDVDWTDDSYVKKLEIIEK